MGENIKSCVPMRHIVQRDRFTQPSMAVAIILRMRPQTSGRLCPTISTSGSPWGGRPTPCVDYGDLNHGQAPLWGLDATAASSKLRLLCCDGRRDGLRTGREHEARQATRLPAP